MIDNTEIKDKLVLITGASGGIGGAVAIQFASAGAHLALTYSTNISSLETLASSLKTSFPDLQISLHEVDLTIEESIQKVFQDVKKKHDADVDILVSNAGYGKRISEIWDIPSSEFDKMIDINLKASFLLVKGVVDGMKAQKWGRIIFISSIAAYGAGINGCHYAASKGGLNSMMMNLSSHLAEFNITVNSVSPAMVGSTGMIPDEDSVPGLVETIPLGRLCKPSEVANVVSMFACTGFVTGQSLVVAGGLKHL
ncbi:NAD(P)-binding protein [Hyaloscypha variabilis F]|uniref:NAD(P)-binding protein n=1 Tax=Hyaloscypha variabilis (strain UAMH 11265 / GT02V1 / F) TaxID=1149755 RepID=A0A2J6S1C3_HYAVF|nr:NAD(P)-binding protein [Hyaloscypha variabilis F]